jgi:Tol biopolymer transport system component
MGDSPSITPPSAKPLEDRLDSWKEIAAYLNRDVTTVQRWEKREGMPVHRHLHDKIGSVYASRAELDAWARSRKIAATRGGVGDGAVTSAATAGSTLRVRWQVLLAAVVAVAAVAIGIGIWLQRTEYFWRSPIADAKFQTVTDFEGTEQAAAVSRDGHFVAFLSDRGGKVDVWITQVGSGQFHNLTHGGAPELANPSLRVLGFSPDGSLVTYWGRTANGSSGSDINVWAVPTLGGDPKIYLQGVAEYDWSRDGTRLAYHTPGPGDPLFVSDGSRRADDRPIFNAPAGLHCHFQQWSPDHAFIYFVQGSLPDKLDIWRIRPTGGPTEQITFHNARVSHPVFLDRRTLLYLASDPDGSGPWLYSVDIERRIGHRLSSGLDRYTSLSASADGRRLVATLASPKKTLWRLPLTSSPAESAAAVPMALTTGTGSAPRLGPGYLLYVAASGASESIWKVANGSATELWKGDGARIVGDPAISPDGNSIAFSAVKAGRASLHLMQADGTNAHIVTDALDAQGTPAWAPDGQSIVTAANDRGTPHLYRVPLDGRSPEVLLSEFSLDPAWSPDGGFIVYSGPDIGTRFSVKAITPEAVVHPLRELNLPRGSRRMKFLARGSSLVLLRGEIQHKDLWLIDLETGAERQLTKLAPDFNISDFDISPDGSEAILERVQERSSVVMTDLPQR